MGKREKGAVIGGIRGKVGIGGKERGAVIRILCCMGGLYGACGGLREYIWPAYAVHVGVAAQSAENEGVRR